MRCAGAHVLNAVKDAMFGRLMRAQPGLLDERQEFRTGARDARGADASEAAKAAPREISGALCAGRPLGRPWRQQGRDAEGREDIVRESDGHADRAESDPRVLLREEMKKLGRHRQHYQACPCHRRRRHGRRHRGLVCRAGHARDAGRHEAGADRRRDQARRRAVRQDRPQARPRCAMRSIA